MSAILFLCQKKAPNAPETGAPSGRAERQHLKKELERLEGDEKPDITKVETEPLSDAAVDRHLATPVERAAQWGKDKLQAVGQKVAEAVPHTPLGDAWAMAQRAGIRILHNHHIADTERLYQKANKAGIKAEVKYSNSAQVLNALTERVAELDKRVGTMKEGGVRNAKAELAAEKERGELVQKIEKAQKLRDKAQVPLEAINNTKARWENAQKKFVEGALTRAQEKMSPYTKRFESLQTQRAQFAAEIANFKTKKEEGEVTLKSLQEQLRSKDTFKFERPEIKAKIAAVQKQLKEMDKQRAAAENADSKLVGRLNKVNGRLGKWQNLQNEFSRVTQRERHYLRPQKDTDAPDLRQREYSFDTEAAQAAEVSPSQQGETKASEPQTQPATQESEHEPASTVKNYVAGWNKYFKAENLL